MSRWSISSEFSFCKGKTRFSRAIAANKRANSHNFKTKNLNLLTITFLADYLMNKGKSSYINLSSMRVNNTSVRSLTVFEEKIVVIVLAKVVLLFSKNLHALFSFPTRSLIDRCQIVTDTCLITFQSLFGSLLNHFYLYANENVLFNLRHLYFNYHLNYHLLAQKLFSLWKILPYLQP